MNRKKKSEQSREGEEDPQQSTRLTALERNGRRRGTAGGEQRLAATCRDKPAKTRVCVRRRERRQREEEERSNRAARTKGRKFSLINFFFKLIAEPPGIKFDPPHN